MNHPCMAFRASLEEALTRRGAAMAQVLGWHEHLLGCGACREILDAEEALDQLLSSLPEARLPDDLARRVLERLRVERSGAALERLLDEVPSPEVPLGLATGVLVGIRETRREGSLDALLDRVPVPAAPQGMAARILDRLAPERSDSAANPGLGSRRAPRMGWVVLAAAAALLLMLGAWLRSGVGRGSESSSQLAQGPSGDTDSVGATASSAGAALPLELLPDELALLEDVEPELLEALDVLENWDWVRSEDLDLLLAEIDPAEWALLEYADEFEDPSEPFDAAGDAQ